MLHKTKWDEKLDDKTKKKTGKINIKGCKVGWFKMNV